MPITPRPEKPKTCQHCGKVFTHGARRTKTCSKECLSALKSKNNERAWQEGAYAKPVESPWRNS